MNARQKAKKYKRMYETLSARSKPPIEFKEENYKIDTLNFSELLELFPEQFASTMADEDYVREFVADNFAKELVKHFDEYVNYYIEKSPIEHFYRLHFQMKVLRKIPKYEAEIITRGNCMACGKELTDGLFLCKECREKARNQESEIQASMRRWL